MEAVPTTYTLQLEEFLNEKYRKEIESLSEYYPEQKSLEIDYAVLDMFSPELADDLLDNPDMVLAAAEKAIESMAILDVNGKAIAPNIRVYNLPQKVLIRNINSEDINKLLTIEGIITKITDVRPKIEIAVFECTNCSREYKLPQSDELYGSLNEPDKCTCERKNFKLNLGDCYFVDMQKMQVQEPLEALVRGEQAKSLDIWMEDDITNKLYPGDKVEITGILRLIPPKKKGSVFSIYLHANHIQKLEKEFEEIEISKEEEEEIKELAADPEIYTKIRKSIAPTIYGHDEIKEALAFQLFGGTKHKKFPDGTRIRPDIHILLIGDPGTAKSQILYYIYNLAPKGIFVSGKSATAAGLTATAEKDEFGEGGWTLKAGALVLASGGMVAIDEFDKMGDEDRSSMHEAMEQQRISIAKAGIVTTFKSETAILAAANPKYGRFDPYESPAEQFNIPPTLLSRFDLIFPIRDVIDEKRDREMAQHILGSHQIATGSLKGTASVLTEEEIKEREDRIRPAIDTGFLRKYISYARQHIQPILTKEAAEKIKEYYVNFRKIGKTSGSVPTTARQLEALVRIAEGSAKARLSPTVDIEDADRSIRLHQFVMKEIGTDPDTGKFDVDIITTGRAKSKTDKIRTLYKIVKNLCAQYDVVTRDMITEEIKNTGIDKNDLQQLLSELQRNGDIYSPKHGQYKTADGNR